jgi:hypothetical protein
MSDLFSGFPHPARNIKKYFNNLSYFMLMLHDGELVPFTAEDGVLFEQWLIKNNIPDIRDIEGF